MLHRTILRRMMSSPFSPMHISLADITRIGRHWSGLLPGLGPQPFEGDGRLEEVPAFGPNPGGLRMLRYIPPMLPPYAPLVVVLHGCMQTAGELDAGTGWSTLAERHGFALLMPEQVHSNNAHNCFNWFEPEDVTRGKGEVASIRNMVAAMLRDNRLDASRIFVTGLSAGGAMTASLLATYPEVFAAGAIIAGLPYGSAGNMHEAVGVMYHGAPRSPAEWGELVRSASPLRQRKPLVSIWHGDADTTVSPVNGLELAKQWCHVHGLRQQDVVEDQVDGTLHRSWRDGSGTVRVELYAVGGLGHGVPITPHAEGDHGVGQAMPFVLESSISSTWRIARSWGLVPPEGVAVTSAVDFGRHGAVSRVLRAVGL